MTTIETKFVEDEKNQVQKYILEKDNGMQLKITKNGATITSTEITDKDRNPEEIVFGFNDLNSCFDSVFQANVPCFGGSEDYCLGWNKGFRGRKSNKLEVCHRVPFFIRWPAGNIQEGNNIADLTTHVDLLPTLAGLCDLKLPNDFEGDGVDSSKLLLNQSQESEDRTVFVNHRQDYRQPKSIEGSCIMNGNGRLLPGKELYNIKEDPIQLNNVAEANPGVVADLLEHNERLIAKAIQRKEYQEFAYTEVGSEYQQKAKFTIQHAIGDDGPIWKPEQIAEGIKNMNASHPISILKKGKYRISCMRWPQENPGAIQGIPSNNPKNLFDYKEIQPEKARITLFGKTYEDTISPRDEKVVFELDLEPGKTMLNTHFIEKNENYGVYYTFVEYVD